jgi:hypothetical protein
MKYEIAKVNDGWVPDWYNDNEAKRSIGMDRELNHYVPAVSYTMQELPDYLYIKDYDTTKLLVNRLINYPLPNEEGTVNVLDWFFMVDSSKKEKQNERYLD